MSTQDTGGTAFPTVNYKKPGGIGVSVMTIEGGMTLRDYFAAKAMQAMLADPSTPDVSPGTVSEWSYRHADAMLEARKS